MNMAVGAQWAEQSILETADLLQFSPHKNLKGLQRRG